MMQRFSRRTLWAVAALAVTSAFAGAQTAPPTQTSPPAEAAKETPPPFEQAQKDAVLARVDRIVTRVAFVPGVDFSNWPTIRAKYEDKLKDAKTPDVFAGILNTAFAEYKVSHLTMLSPRYVQSSRQQRSVGMGILPEFTKDGIKVNGVFPGSPADKAGLQEGDLITTSNGKPATTAEAIAGGEGTELNLKVKGKDGKVRDVKVIKAQFSTKIDTTFKWLNTEVAYMHIPSFESSFNRKVIEASITELNEKAGKLLILDMRSNPGGALMNLLVLGGYLMTPEQSMGLMLNRDMVDQFVKETEKQPNDYPGIFAWSKDQLRPFKQKVTYSGKLAVMINGGSGSAAEIAAAALQESRGAKVFGSKSAGAVLAATMIPLREGFQIMVPIQDYLTPSGRRLEGNGVIPDFLVRGMKPMSPNAPDPAVDSVLQWYKENK